MGSSKGKSSFLVAFSNRAKGLGVGRAASLSATSTRARVKDEFLGSLDTSDTFNNEVFTSNGTGLVETADIHSSSPWDTERLGTENGFDMYLARGKKG